MGDGGRRHHHDIWKMKWIQISYHCNYICSAYIYLYICFLSWQYEFLFTEVCFGECGYEWGWNFKDWCLFWKMIARVGYHPSVEFLPLRCWLLLWRGWLSIWAELRDCLLLCTVLIWAPVVYYVLLLIVLGALGFQWGNYCNTILIDIVFTIVVGCGFQMGQIMLSIVLNIVLTTWWVFNRFNVVEGWREHDAWTANMALCPLY